jgi:hypothetical protein
MGLPLVALHSTFSIGEPHSTLAAGSRNTIGARRNDQGDEAASVDSDGESHQRWFIDCRGICATTRMTNYVGRLLLAVPGTDSAVPRSAPAMSKSYARI